MKLVEKTDDSVRKKKSGIFRRYFWDRRAVLTLVVGLAGLGIGIYGSSLYYSDKLPKFDYSHEVCRAPARRGDNTCSFPGTLTIYPLSNAKEREAAQNALESIFNKRVSEIPKTMETLLMIYDWTAKNIRYEEGLDPFISHILAEGRGDCDQKSKVMGALVTMVFGESVRLQSSMVIMGEGRDYSSHQYVEVNLVSIYGQISHHELVESLANDLQRHYGVGRDKALGVIDRELAFNPDGVWLAFETTNTHGIDGIFAIRRFAGRIGTYYLSGAESPDGF